MKNLEDYLYYEEENPSIKIYLGDCLTIMPLLPKVDLVVTDPPYGIGENYESYEDSEINLDGLIKSTVPMIIDKAKVCLFTTGIPSMFSYPKPDWVLCWHIPSAVSSGPWGFITWSPILAYGKCPFLSNGKGRMPTVITRTETAIENGHPTPKPLGFWKRLMIRGGAEMVDSILDPFLGSGTTLVACKELKRNGIGIEISEKYCQIAKTRLQNTQVPFL